MAAWDSSFAMAVDKMGSIAGSLAAFMAPAMGGCAHGQGWVGKQTPASERNCSRIKKV